MLRQRRHGLRTSIRLENTETHFSYNPAKFLKKLKNLDSFREYWNIQAMGWPALTCSLKNLDSFREYWNIGTSKAIHPFTWLKNLDSFREYWNSRRVNHFERQIRLRTSIRLENTETRLGALIGKHIIMLKNLDSFREYWNWSIHQNITSISRRLRTSIRLENTETNAFLRIFA